MGYSRAGFEVVGVDIEPQPRYPFEFHQADALAVLDRFAGEFDAIHASPPCQAHSNAQRIQGRTHVDLIEPVRELLKASGKLYVIENVPGAPLVNPVKLVGSSFDLGTMRPRLFECNFDVPFALAPPPAAGHAKMGRNPKPGELMHVVGNFTNVAAARRAMGIDWMTRDGLREAIPPAYTEYLGKLMIDEIQRSIK